MEIEDIIRERVRKAGYREPYTIEVSADTWEYRIDGRGWGMVISQESLYREQQKRKSLRQMIPNRINISDSGIADAFGYMRQMPRDFEQARRIVEEYNQAWYPPPKEIKNEPKPIQQKVLILGSTAIDSRQAAEILGFTNWVHVSHYKDMMNYPGLSVYVTELGHERDDFGAIEGLFLRGGHTVTYLMD